MKRTLTILIVISLLLTLLGCDAIDTNSGSKNQIAPVPDPMAYPDYTFDQTPTTDMLRQRAVEAMRDLLSIQWTPAEGISYFNIAGRDKQFDYTPGTIYGGLLYSGAGSGLFQYLEYYDQETGILQYPGTSDELRKTLGSGCADSLLWSWGTVANSFSSGYYPSVMVWKNGYIPVGDYVYEPNLTSFYMLSTKNIIGLNGEDVMLTSYAKALPADALISSTSDHAMMVIEPPHVEYTQDGSIDPQNSYILIQDQRGGNTATTFIEEDVDGATVHYNSQRSLKQTFAELLKNNYIPVTAAEFIGEKPYEKAAVTTQGKVCTKFKDLQNVMLESNYPIALIRVVLQNDLGVELELDKILFHGATGDGPPTTYNLSQWETLHTLETTNYTQLRIEVVVSTGETFTPIMIRL